MYITKFVGHERDLQANNNARQNDVLIKRTIALIYQKFKYAQKKTCSYSSSIIPSSGIANHGLAKENAITNAGKTL